MSEQQQEATSGQKTVTIVDFKDITQSFSMFFDRVKEENTLINNRFTWLVTIQSFMIAGVSVIYSYYLQTFAPIFKEGIIKEIIGNPLSQSVKLADIEKIQQLKNISDESWSLIIIISIAGFLVSLTSLGLQVMAALSIKSLESEWNSNGFSNIKKVVGGKDKKFVPDLTNGSQALSSKCGFIFGVAIPFVFSVVWLALLYIFISFKPSL